MTMTRSGFSPLLAEGLREVYFDTLNLNTLVYPQIYDIRKTTKKTETDHSVTGIGMLTEKQEGEPTEYEDFVDGYDSVYTTKTFSRGIRITQEMIEDDQYSVMSNRTKALSNATRYRMEYDHFSLFVNAANTNVFTGGDGLALASTAHTLIGVAGTTIGNYVSTNLTLGALETAFAHFRNMKNDQNLFVYTEPNTLLVPPALEFDAWEILNSAGKPGTANNDDNYFKSKLKLVVSPFLTDTNCWAILADKRYGAPISFNRVPVSFKNDGDFDTDDLKMKARVRYSYGASDWRWLYWSAGT